MRRGRGSETSWNGLSPRPALTLAQTRAPGARSARAEENQPWLVDPDGEGDEILSHELLFALAVGAAAAGGAAGPLRSLGADAWAVPLAER